MPPSPRSRSAQETARIQILSYDPLGWGGCLLGQIFFTRCVVTTSGRPQGDEPKFSEQEELLLCRERQSPVKPGEPGFPLFSDANHLGSYAREKPGKYSIFFNIQ